MPFLQPGATGTATTPLFEAESSATHVVLNTPREAFVYWMTGQAMSATIWILALGVALRLGWLATGLWRVRSLVSNARPDDSALAAMDALQRELGTGATILISDELDGPATIGVRHAVVLLPRAVLAMSTPVQRAIVCHELVHVRRRAWLHTIGEEVWCAALWFHPVASAALTAAVVERLPMSSAPAQRPTVYRPGNGVSLPTVVKEVKPAYTAAAMQAKIQGSVWLECVVTAKGDMGDVKVTRSLDPELGLDDAAVKAAKQWKLKAGMKDGKPVAVAITLELTFTLKK